MVSESSGKQISKNISSLIRPMAIQPGIQGLTLCIQPAMNMGMANSVVVACNDAVDGRKRGYGYDPVRRSIISA